MSAGSMSFRHFILGLLTQQPMSGYSIKCTLENFSWLVGKPSFGSLYPALHALLNDNLVTVEVVTHESKPPSKVYSITQRGRQVLKEWVQQPAGTSTSLKDFVMRLMLADNFDHDGLIAQLRQRRDQVAAHHTDLEHLVTTPSDSQKLQQQLALDYGLALATAGLNWLDRKLDQLSEQVLLMEDLQKG